MGKHARDLPRDNLLVNQNDAWRYKVTRQRTRLTINFNTRHHQISRRCFPRWTPHRTASVSIGIGYRTTNAPFTNDDHPERARGSGNEEISVTGWPICKGFDPAHGGDRKSTFRNQAGLFLRTIKGPSVFEKKGARESEKEERFKGDRRSWWIRRSEGATTEIGGRKIEEHDGAHFELARRGPKGRQEGTRKGKEEEDDSLSPERSRRRTGLPGVARRNSSLVKRAIIQGIAPGPQTAHKLWAFNFAILTG
ncbi:hypothetical protein WH47_03520 [Habropoda laboriosa]|uniref:Uncharacterized protein n=1 Tax=Habropoda laboriosa TaxID=597456 RepID=A0A0L7RBR1_9HYME|nr:hypothetical protein WH47_03520 [Habropoda laboriosa]